MVDFMAWVAFMAFIAFMARVFMVTSMKDAKAQWNKITNTKWEHTEKPMNMHSSLHWLGGHGGHGEGTDGESSGCYSWWSWNPCKTQNTAMKKMTSWNMKWSWSTECYTWNGKHWVLHMEWQALSAIHGMVSTECYTWQTSYGSTVCWASEHKPISLNSFFGASIYWPKAGSWPWLEIHQWWLVKLVWAVSELAKLWAMNWLASWWCPKSWSTARWTNLFIHPWVSLGLTWGGL